MSKAVLDSSVIIALSHLGYLSHLNLVFDEVLVPRAVYEEICIKGRRLTGDHELRESLRKGLIKVRKIENRVLVNALLDPLSLGEAEALALTVQEEADYLVVDDKLARRRARAIGLDVIGTLRVFTAFLRRWIDQQKRNFDGVGRTEKVRLQNKRQDHRESERRIINVRLL